MIAKQIAEARGIKEVTVWDHAANLIEHHQLQLKSVIANDKIKRILRNIKSPNDKLKEIKERVNDDSISYNEITCVLASVKAEHRKKSVYNRQLSQFVQKQH